MQIKVAVARATKGACRNNLVALVEVATVRFDQVMQEHVVDLVGLVSGLGWNAHQPRQFAGDGYDSEVSRRWTTARTQGKSDTESFVDDMREGMRRVDGNRGQEGVDPTHVK